jgi:hypothetical protein
MSALKYRGYLIEWPRTPQGEGVYQVTLSSEDAQLMQTLSQPSEQITRPTLEEAIISAFDHIDDLLQP